MVIPSEFPEAVALQLSLFRIFDRRNQLFQVAVLVHLSHDVTATDKLALNKQLRDRWPATAGRSGVKQQ